MTIVLVPLEYDDLEALEPVWAPFIARIAKKSRNTVEELVSQVKSGEVRLHLAWDAIKKEAQALAGTRIYLRGGDKVGELVWCSGSGRHHWLPLLDELERFHIDHLGCVGMQAVARMGWVNELKQRGYRMTHAVCIKEFAQ